MRKLETSKFAEMNWASCTMVMHFLGLGPLLVCKWYLLSLIYLFSKWLNGLVTQVWAVMLRTATFLVLIAQFAPVSCAITFAFCLTGWSSMFWHTTCSSFNYQKFAGANAWHERRGCATTTSMGPALWSSLHVCAPLQSAHVTPYCTSCAMRQPGTCMATGTATVTPGTSGMSEF